MREWIRVIKTGFCQIWKTSTQDTEPWSCRGGGGRCVLLMQVTIAFIFRSLFATRKTCSVWSTDGENRLAPMVKEVNCLCFVYYSVSGDVRRHGASTAVDLKMCQWMSGPASVKSNKYLTKDSSTHQIPISPTELEQACSAYKQIVPSSQPPTVHGRLVSKNGGWSHIHTVMSVFRLRGVAWWWIWKLWWFFAWAVSASGGGGVGFFVGCRNRRRQTVALVCVVFCAAFR